MKKLLSIAFVLMLAMSLTACGETKEEKTAKTVDKVIEMAEKTGEKVDDQTKEMMKNALNSSKEFQDEVADTMDQMPKIMKVAKSYRDCLKDADDKDEAIECYEEADKYADKLGINENDDEEFNADEEFGDWTVSEKEKFLSEMDNDLKSMEQFSQ